MGKKKYNKQTKGYKIDIFYDGIYYCSTDFYKRCKDALASVLNTKKAQLYKKELFKARFDRNG